MSAKSILRGYLDSLERQEKIEFVQLQKAWTDAYMAVRNRIENLPDNPTLGELSIVQTLLTQANKRYAIASARIISEGQREFGEQGIKSARQMLNLTGGKVRELPIESVGKYVGDTSNGQPLDAFLLTRYDAMGFLAVTALTRTDKVAIAVASALAIKLLTRNLSKSLQVARTEQMFAFRGMQTEQFADSGFVREKNWVGEPDACARICKPGIAGSPYPLSYVMVTHPNCRCGWEPVLTAIGER